MLRQNTIEYFYNEQKYIGELVYLGELDNTRRVIILFSAFEGRGDFISEYATMLANNGYVAFIADIYGNGQVFSDMDTIFLNLKPLLANRNEVRQRSVSAYETIKSLPWVNQNQIGAIGFCLGGMCVLELARSGVGLKAGVSVHGVLSKSELTTVKPIKTKVLILAGHADPQVPNSESFNNFIEEMNEANNNDWIFTFFGGVKHSFSDTRTGSFD